MNRVIKIITLPTLAGHWPASSRGKMNSKTLVLKILIELIQSNIGKTQELKYFRIMRMQ